MAITKVSITSTPAAALAASTSRTWVAIANIGSVAVSIAFTNDASGLTVDSGSYPGIPIAAGGMLFFTTESGRIQHVQNAIWATTQTSTSTLAIHEG